MKQQIVFINQSSGYLMIDIIEAFKDTYQERILLTGSLNFRNKKLDNSVKLVKLISYNRSSALTRIISWFWAFAKALYIIKTKYPKAHLFLVSNPPFSTWIPLFCKNTYDLLIYDVYPDALVEFGYFKKDSWFIKKWANINRKVYKKAIKVSTITEGIKKRLSIYVDNSIINVVPIWTDNTFLKPIAKVENEFLKLHKVSDKFIVMYSGNMGKSHPIELLIELAIKHKNNPKLFFFLIGGGDKYKNMKLLIESKKLKNIKILPWQDTSILPYTLSSADLALVTLGNEASDLSIPSKTYNLMSTGTPIICVAPPTSALAKLIEHEKIGVVFQENNLDEISKFIEQSMKNETFLLNLKNKALQASLNYTPLNADKFL